MPSGVRRLGAVFWKGIMKKRILLIEDDPDMIVLLRIHFEQTGAEVLVAQDGVVGLEMIRERRPDAVDLDIKLPRKNGYEVCAAVQMDDELKAIPLVVITGLTETQSAAEDAQWCNRMGVADFLSKPFEPDELVDRVMKAIPVA